MTKEIIIDKDIESFTYLEKMYYEVNTYILAVDRILTNHKDDTDLSLFTSKVWKHFYSCFEKSNTEYEMIKEKFGKEVVSKYTDGSINFTWTVMNFTEGRIQIQYNE